LPGRRSAACPWFALFTRGETQALVVTTLGTGQDEQIIGRARRRVPPELHAALQLPAYATNEAGRMGSPGRREIGHASLPGGRCIPCCRPMEGFPYTIRVVSEITESNGSSSMATVCGASLSMMDAGVPLTRPVAGNAMD